MYRRGNTDNEALKMIKNRLRQHIDIFSRVLNDPKNLDSLKAVEETVCRSVQSGSAIYLCGNGGSAADAQHIATEFVSRFYKERRAINAEALTTNTSSLTAVANDYDFDRIFVRQLEAKGRRGDVLIGISTSGTSRNVIKTIEYAAANGMHTILLTGDNDIEYDSAVYENVIKVPSKDTPRIQEAHIFIGHMIAEYVESKIEEQDSLGEAD